MKPPFGYLPLPIRNAVYGPAFLAVVLVALPWAFYQIDVRVPALHVEIGRLRVVGAVLFVVNVALYVSALAVLIRRGRGAYVEFDPPTELVVAGPYRYARNPVASCLLGSMLGEAVGLSSTGILAMFCLFVMLAHLQVTRLEEPILRKRFGAAYVAYCAHVPRWIPRRPLVTRP